MTDDQIKELIERLRWTAINESVPREEDTNLRVEWQAAEALSSLLKERGELRNLIQQRGASDMPQCDHPGTEQDA